MKIRITIENSTTQEIACQSTAYSFDNAMIELASLERYCGKHTCVTCGEPFSVAEYGVHCSDACKENLHDPKDDLPF